MRVLSTVLCLLRYVEGADGRIICLNGTLLCEGPRTRCTSRACTTARFCCRPSTLFVRLMSSFSRPTDATKWIPRYVDYLIQICLTFTGFHEESWQPAWGIRTALLGVQALMTSKADESGTGAVVMPGEDRKKLAAQYVMILTQIQSMDLPTVQMHQWRVPSLRTIRDARDVPNDR